MRGFMDVAGDKRLGNPTNIGSGIGHRPRRPLGRLGRFVPPEDVSFGTPANPAVYPRHGRSRDKGRHRTPPAHDVPRP